jgi:hypothetical protein
MTHLAKLRRKQRNRDDLRVNNGDVAGVVPTDLMPSRDLEADKAEITRRLEDAHDVGALDVATGGHLANSLIDSFHAENIAALRDEWKDRHAVVERLVGEAEAAAQRERERLDAHHERYLKEKDLLHQALLELVGETTSERSFVPALPHHGETCPRPTAKVLVPWQSSPPESLS